MIALIFSYALAITGTVPVVCWARDGEYLCNDPAGFTLYQDGKAIEFSGPAKGKLPGVLVIKPRQVRP